MQEAISSAIQRQACKATCLSKISVKQQRPSKTLRDMYLKYFVTYHYCSDPKCSTWLIYNFNHLYISCWAFSLCKPVFKDELYLRLESFGIRATTMSSMESNTARLSMRMDTTHLSVLIDLTLYPHIVPRYFNPAYRSPTP